jgi:hypothetical protein
MKLFIGLTIALAALPLPAAGPYGDRFASGKASDYLEGNAPAGQVRIAPIGGVNTLFIADARARLKTVPVTPNTKYTLSFDGSFTGDVESIEDNPRFEVFTRPGRKSSILPSREIQFLDAAGKTIKHTLVFSMPFREEHTYTDVFYTPPAAVALRLGIASPKGVTCAIRNLKLKKTLDEGAVNINPALGLGAMNYSGWRHISAGGKIIKKGGKTVFDTKYGSRGMAFPLQTSGTYALSARATSNGYNSCVILEVFDAKGKTLMRSVVRRYGRTNYFVLPKNAVSASLLVYSCLLEEVRLVRAGDAKSIDTFLKKPNRKGDR